MNMKERMLKGLPCLTFERELLDERNAQQRRQFDFNNLDPEDFEGRVKALKEMLGGCTDNVWMERPIYFDYGKNTYVGDNFYANTGLTVLDGAKVTIGDKVFCAPYVGIYTAGHPVHPYPTRTQAVLYSQDMYHRWHPLSQSDHFWNSRKF